MNSDGPIYLDCHAHAPMDPRVAETLADAYHRFDANPHSTHLHGEAARRAVETARVQVADLIGADPAEIVFTSGATEANNLALHGMLGRLAATGSTRVLVAAGEHASVLAAADAITDGTAERIPLLESGIVDLEILARELDRKAGLVCVAAANHEIGTIQPIARISALTRDAGALLHCDLAQAAGKIPVDASLFDLGSVSAHKLGGPLGIGALYVRRGLRRHVRPMTVGGGQEGGLRSGTVAAPLCVAFGEACRLAASELNVDALRMAALRDELLERLREAGGVEVNGGRERLPGNLNVSFQGVDAEALTLRVRGAVSISTGSACASSALEPSHVLKAIGLKDRRAESAVRFGLGRSTTPDDIAAASAAVVGAVRALRSTLRKVA